MNFEYSLSSACLALFYISRILARVIGVTEKADSFVRVIREYLLS